MPISPDRILYLDDHLLAVNKLSGELVVKGSSLRQGYGRQEGPVGKLPLFDFLKKEYTGLKVVHRLDFETSGVVVFGRGRGLGIGDWNNGDPAFGSEIAQARGGSGIRKKLYRALIMGRMKEKKGVIRKKLPARGRGEVDAVTRYRVLKQFKDCAYIEAEIETGRYHQIRRHFAGIGHPLALDHVYGDRKANSRFTKRFRYRKFFLHAYSVELKHPVTGEEIRIEAEIPRVFVEVLERLR